MAGTTRREPGALKRAVMRTLWDSPEPLSANEVRASLGREGTTPALTTVLTVLERLGASGEVVRHREGGQESRFEPARPESAATADAMLEALLSSHDRAGALLKFTGSLDSSDAALLRKALGAG